MAARPPEERPAGTVARVAGPVVVAADLPGARLYELVRVGTEGLVGEVVRVEGASAVVQVYEDTVGLRVGEPVVGTGAPLEVELGPGLLGGLFDGVQRPLRLMMGPEGSDARPFVTRGPAPAPLDRERVWTFDPAVVEGGEVRAGAILGTVQERALVHRILAPPGVGGVVTRVREGPARVADPVVWVDGRPLRMLQRWPVRQRRPAARRLATDEPLVTGQRAIDTLFPVARGGSAIAVGGFGTGKTVLEQSLARWVEADVIVYVACGERGNELTEILEGFAGLTDPRTGAPLMDRTILVANTSNMPVVAREASIYTGITVAEYYRDQGYHVALMADSTSRWAEALREVSSRIEEMPGEEGYPAYLGARLAELYERAGLVACLGDEGRRGSVTVVGAVSPPAGDLSEPVTRESLRLAGALWALDTDLARRRHFPAIHWARSYTLYDLGRWFSDRVTDRWEDHRRWAMALLQREEELLSIVQLLGTDALAPAERVVLLTGRWLRDDFLRQSAFDEVDASCPLEKQHVMLSVIRHAHEAAAAAVARGIDVERVASLPTLAEIGGMRSWPPDQASARARDLCARIDEEVAGL